MQVNNIQPNTTFSGKFNNNIHLQNVMDCAKKCELKRFEKLLQKMQSVPDNWQYSLNIEDKFNYDEFNTTRRLILSSNSLNCANFRTVGSETVNRMLEPFHDKYYEKALKRICSCIEDDYAEAERNKPKTSIIDRINNILNKK